MNCARFCGCLSHVPRVVRNSEKGEKRKIPTFPMYIVLYTPSTDHIQYYNMSYSEGDDSDGNCESFSASRLAMTKAVTVART